MLAVDDALLLTSASAFGGVLIAAYLGHLYKVRQWRYERTYDACAAFIGAAHKAREAASGVWMFRVAQPGDEAEDDVRDRTSQLRRDMNSALSEMRQALGPLELCASPEARVDAQAVQRALESLASAARSPSFDEADAMDAISEVGGHMAVLVFHVRRDVGADSYLSLFKRTPKPVKPVIRSNADPQP